MSKTDIDPQETVLEPAEAALRGTRAQVSAGIERGREQLNAGLERGREAAGNLWAEAQQRPWAAAAIVGGVVATAAAATAGAVYLNRKRRNGTADDAEATDVTEEISAATRIPPPIGTAAE